MIKEFSNAEYGVIRTSFVEDQPYFCLVDIARLLDIKNVQECRTKIPANEIKTIEVPDEKGKAKRLFISANNISTCMFASKKAEAQMINDWLYRIVLPQLLKFGDYQVDDFHDPNVVIKFLDEYQDIKVRNSVLETDKKINEPKLKYINKLLGSSQCVDLDIAHDVLKFKGIGSMELFKILRATHILDDRNQPFQEYCDRKYFRVVETKSVAGGTILISTRTYVYKSGITFIERILSEYEVTKNAQRNRKPLYAQ